jgi:hypothetical protein
MEKYTLTPEHEAQLKPWADKWIENALRCGDYTKDELEALPIIIKGLYKAAELAEPKYVVTCQDPISAAIAWSFASAIHWFRETPDKHKELFGKSVNEADYANALLVACSTLPHNDPLAGLVYETAQKVLGDAAPLPFTAKAADASDKVETSMVAFLHECLGHWSRGRQGGNHWSGYVAYLSFFRYVVKLDIDYSKWDWYERAAVYGPRFVHKHFCIVSELPTYIHQDENNQPHRADGPFCEWPSGRKLYYWHGTKLPAAWLENPDSVDAMEVYKEPPSGLSADVVIDVFGWDRVLKNARLTIKDSDDTAGELVSVDAFRDKRFLRYEGKMIAVPVECKTALEARFSVLKD